MIRHNNGSTKKISLPKSLLPVLVLLPLVTPAYTFAIGANFHGSTVTNSGAQYTATVPEPDFWLVVWLHDGSKVIKHLADKPTVRYDADKFVLVASGFTAEYDTADVRKFTLSDNPDGEEHVGVTDIEGDAPTLSRLDREAVTITGGIPGAVTMVYGVRGILAGQYTADSAGTTVIPLDPLPEGVLIIKTETITYKIIKR